MKSEKISFVTNATTKEALAYIMLYTWVIIRNVGKAINCAVHKLPWIFIIATATASFIVSFVCIGKARAERDSYNKKLVNTTMQLNSYKAVYEDGREVR